MYGGFELFRLSLAWKLATTQEYLQATVDEMKC